ncbi:hypothetical protein E1293_19865 [Actinomadura darangshiensis]|uniref:Uncharacterized protein n=1 Tax=Actinomadura darangshiensis TaxID=705336 RepID=A0A4R5BBE2_9ACTN|nr:hypothetical protein [Actinomadura darangshiensis]TDD80802.1 hypothetical protein E1293_19865 [Actinomadura darangshiensis]
MARIKQTAIIGTAALAVLAAGIAPASAAAGTTIRKGSATADAYSGNVQASLLGTATVSTSIGDGSCTESTMTGSINSDGSDLSVSSATFSGDNGGACSGTTSATIETQNLPWTGGSVAFDAGHTNGRDGTVTIANFSVKATVDIFGGITCEFGGNLTANGFNGDNASRPDTGSSEAQVGVQGAQVSKTGGSFLCPGTATVTANYALTGETTAGSGTYDQSLYVTG